MSTLTQGNNVTVTLATAYDSIEITSLGNVTVEYPVGTKIADFTGTRVFGPYAIGAAVKITAVAGSVQYQTINGTNTGRAATADVNDVTGGLEFLAGDNAVISSGTDAPNDADGKPDGSIYFQI